MTAEGVIGTTRRDHGELDRADWLRGRQHGRAKKRIGERLQSPATTGEGIQNILCAYLSLAILIGLAANAILGLWWADPLVALIVATVALQTGARSWRGQTCEVGC